ncbi:predicted protein [Verticillium alfalfae VaMs.102]|uniref:Predicted protein n=1 Tax=Verticillium alfalfae (strain VaMs.102 / ATCC MYA-4576 / FGSC 10136) TaxID=526221 RepID=C9SED5_VERA1|nr:predicted protein [Verticillium alfalfae VaMs.102]EEY16528.1 predicted protein [Verticillium alfalfae VaMs.102]
MSQQSRNHAALPFIALPFRQPRGGRDPYHKPIWAGTQSARQHGPQADLGRSAAVTRWLLQLALAVEARGPMTTENQKPIMLSTPASPCGTPKHGTTVTAAVRRLVSTGQHPAGDGHSEACQSCSDTWPSPVTSAMVTPGPG